MLWTHPSKGKMEFSEVCEFIRERVNQAGPDMEIHILLGSDSQAHNHLRITRYVTALIVHTVGKGATYFILKQDETLAPSLRQKIWREAIITLEHAFSIDNELADILILDNVSFQVHADLGENGPTRELIKEVTGMFIAAGYNVVTKPYSVAASTTADKYSK